MNMIHQWARLVDESFHPTARDNEETNNATSEEFDRMADKWDELQAQIAEINRKLDKNGGIANEAENDDEEDDGSIDPEIEKAGKSIDDFANQYGQAGERNDRMASQVPDDYDPKADDTETDDGEERENGRNALMGGQYGQEVAKLKAGKGTDLTDKYYIQFHIMVDYPQLTAKERDFVTSYETLMSIPVSQKNVDIFKIESRNTLEEAKKVVEATVNNPKLQKWTDGAKLEDYKTDYVDPKSGNRVSRASQKIKRVDPNAIEFYYTNTTVNDKSEDNVIKHRGPSGEGDTDYNKKDKIVICQFDVYKAFAPIAFNDRQDKFFEQILKEFDPEEYERLMDQKRQREIYQNALKDLSRQQKEMDAELKQQYLNRIEKIISALVAKDGGEESLVKILKPGEEEHTGMADLLRDRFGGKSDEEISNLTAEDFSDFTLGQLKNILIRLGDDSIKLSDDEEDFEMLQNMSNSDIDKMADDIIQAEKGARRTIDGYATRSDAEDDDEEQDNNNDGRGGITHRFGNYDDDDPDNYENNQY